MEDMTLNNSAANAEVNMNESTSVNENVSVGTDTPTVLPESPVIGFQAVDAEGNVLGFVSKAELVNEAKQALYADLAILEANRPTTLPANDMLAATSTLAATDVYEDQLAIKSDAPYIRGLDATGNPIRISKADLASVVGGLLGTNNMFRYTGDNPKTLDFNEIKTNGIYFFTNDDGKTYTNFPPMFTNAPSGTVKAPYAALKIYTNGNAVLQECVLYNGKTAVRHYNQVSKSWADWKQYSLSE